MGLPKVEKCCLCVNVQIGTIVIGVIDLIGSITQAVSIGTILATPLDSYVEGFGNNEEEIKENMKILNAFRDSTAVIGLICCIIVGIAACLLLFATFKKSPQLMLPYIIVKGVEFCIWLLLVVLFIILAIILFVYGHAPAGFAMVFFTIILALGALLIRHFFATVYTHYCNMKDELARGQYAKPEADEVYGV